MKNANKSAKIAMVMEIESESVSGTGSPPRVNKFFRLVGAVIATNFNVGLVIQTDGHNDRQSECQTVA